MIFFTDKHYICLKLFLEMVLFMNEKWSFKTKFVMHWICNTKFDINMEKRINMKHTCRKFPKYSDTQKLCSNHSKIWTLWLYHRVMSPNDGDGMANNVDPDQTGSALFAQAYLSKNLGSLW